MNNRAIRCVWGLVPAGVCLIAAVAAGGDATLDPRGTVHIPIGIANTLDSLKTFVEAEGIFSPGVGTYGIYFWVYDPAAGRADRPDNGRDCMRTRPDRRRLPDPVVAMEGRRCPGPKRDVSRPAGLPRRASPRRCCESRAEEHDQAARDDLALRGPAAAGPGRSRRPSSERQRRGRCPAGRRQARTRRKAATRRRGSGPDRHHRAIRDARLDAAGAIRDVRGRELLRGAAIRCER